jgi:hypothetical protein
VRLRALVLLDVVDEYFQPAACASVVEVKPEPAYLERFPAAFVLPGVDSGIERLDKLIVAAEERVFIQGVVAVIDVGRKRRGLDRHRFVDWGDNVGDLDPEVFGFVGCCIVLRKRGDIFPAKGNAQRALGYVCGETTLAVCHHGDRAGGGTNINGHIRDEFKLRGYDRTRKRPGILGRNGRAHDQRGREYQ